MVQCRVSMLKLIIWFRAIFPIQVLRTLWPVDGEILGHVLYPTSRNHWTAEFVWPGVGFLTLRVQ